MISCERLTVKSLSAASTRLRSTEASNCRQWACSFVSSVSVNLCGNQEGLGSDELLPPLLQIDLGS